MTNLVVQIPCSAQSRRPHRICRCGQINVQHPGKLFRGARPGPSLCKIARIKVQVGAVLTLHRKGVAEPSQRRHLNGSQRTAQINQIAAKMQST
ncbi:MAG: hypothetical protein Q4G20_12340 [Paracoccus sp. (in: a-proteobacteria)]|nr:hypothetical protein [Paracoccus sp. (in: a-proteobacteria)]MDO5648711.1 hypothetical protein [Paracoccus sp. (in: a-proteobacteria)]